MIKTHIKKAIFIFLLMPLTVFAEIPSWTMNPKDSSLTFTATQNDAPVTGTFPNFSAVINFDPAQLDKSNVKIIVNMGAISDAYNELADTLKDADWFNVKTFPQATFQSTEFTKTGDKTYQAKGSLTIRDTTKPIILNFTQEEYTQNKAKITGSTTIKRTDFGIGQGEWSHTDTVKDDVQINFTITAQKK